MITDQEKLWVEAIRAGGRKMDDCIGQLMYNHWKGLILNLVRERHLDWKDPMVQSEIHLAFIKLVDAIDKRKFNEKSMLSTYFYTILKNVLIDYTRRVNRHPAYTMELKDHMVNYNPVEESDKQHYQRQHISLALNRLSKVCRKVIEDRFMARYTPKEMMSMSYYIDLGLSQGQLFDKIKTCKQKIKGYLKDIEL